MLRPSTRPIVVSSQTWASKPEVADVGDVVRGKLRADQAPGSTGGAKKFEPRTAPAAEVDHHIAVSRAELLERPNLPARGQLHEEPDDRTALRERLVAKVVVLVERAQMLPGQAFSLIVEPARGTAYDPERERAVGLRNPVVRPVADGARRRAVMRAATSWTIDHLEEREELGLGASAKGGHPLWALTGRLLDLSPP